MLDMQKMISALMNVPSDNKLWTAQDVAAYLGCEVKTCQNRFFPDPSFPPAIRIKGGHPKWEPGEVKRWARSFKEKRRR